MKELIAKLEAAKEGSRQLDHEIAVAVEKYKEPPVTALDTDWWTPHYSTSIDAALTLVPKSWDKTCREVGGECNASVGPPRAPDIESSGATPALALCIASLRARAAG